MLRRTTTALQQQKATSDCVIIGAGIVGTCIALELARSQSFCRITVVDANTQGPGAGTTSFSSGVIRTFYSHPDSIRAAWECYHVWKNWADYLELDSSSSLSSSLCIAHMRECPGWWLKSSATQSFNDAFLPQARRSGIRVHELDFKTTEAFAAKLGWNVADCFARSSQGVDDPDFGRPTGEKITGSVLVPQAGYVADPRLATQNVHDAAKKKLGGVVEFRFGAEVVGVTQSHGRVTGVRCCLSREGGTELAIEAPVVINAAGPHSSAITAMAFPKDGDGPANDMALTTRPLLAECALVESPDGVDFQRDGVISFDVETGFYARPDGGGGMLVGGLDLPGDPLEKIPVADLRRFEAEQSARAKMDGDQAMMHLHRFALRVPGAKLPSTRSQLRGVCSTYDVTEDWAPIVDGSSALRGYAMAIGTSGNCFKLAPLIGKMMRASLTQEATSIDLPLSGGKEEGEKFDLTAFSRLRKPFDVVPSVIG